MNCLGDDSRQTLNMVTRYFASLVFALAAVFVPPTAGSVGHCVEGDTVLHLSSDLVLGEPDHLPESNPLPTECCVACTPAMLPMERPPSDAVIAGVVAPAACLPLEGCDPERLRRPPRGVG